MVKPYRLRSNSEPSNTLTITRAKRAVSATPSNYETHKLRQNASNTSSAAKLDLVLTQGTLSSQQGRSCKETSACEVLTPDSDMVPLTHSTPKPPVQEVSASLKGSTAATTIVETQADYSTPAEIIPLETQVAPGGKEEISLIQDVSLCVEPTPVDLAPSSQRLTPPKQLKGSSPEKPVIYTESSSTATLSICEITDKQSKPSEVSPVTILTAKMDEKTNHDKTLGEVETVKKKEISQGIANLPERHHLELVLEKRLLEYNNPQIINFHKLPKNPEKAIKTADNMEERKNDINDQPICVHKIVGDRDSVKVAGSADCDVSSSSDKQDSDKHTAISMDKTNIVSCDSAGLLTKSNPNAYDDDVEEKLTALFEGHTFGIDSPKGIADNSELNEPFQSAIFDCSFGVHSPNSMVSKDLSNQLPNSETSSDRKGTANVQDTQPESSTTPAEHSQANTGKIVSLSDSLHLEDLTAVLGTNSDFTENVDMEGIESLELSTAQSPREKITINTCNFLPIKAAPPSTNSASSTCETQDISQTGRTHCENLDRLADCQNVTQVSHGKGLGNEKNLNISNNDLQTRGDVEAVAVASLVLNDLLQGSSSSSAFENGSNSSIKNPPKGHNICVRKEHFPEDDGPDIHSSKIENKNKKLADSSDHQIQQSNEVLPRSVDKTLNKRTTQNAEKDSLSQGSETSCKNHGGSPAHHKNLLNKVEIKGSSKPCNAGTRVHTSSPRRTTNRNARTPNKHLSQVPSRAAVRPQKETEKGPFASSETLRKRIRSQNENDDKRPKRRKENTDVGGLDSVSETSSKRVSMRSPSSGVSDEVSADKDKDTVLLKSNIGNNAELIPTTIPNVLATKPETIQVTLLALSPRIDGLLRRDSKNLLKGFCWSGCKRLTVFSFQMWKTDEATNVVMPCCRHCMKVEGVARPTEIDFWFTATVRPVGTESTMEVIFSSRFGAKFLGCSSAVYVSDPAQRKRVHLKLLNLLNKPFKLRCTKVKVEEEYHYRAA